MIFGGQINRRTSDRYSTHGIAVFIKLNNQMSW